MEVEGLGARCALPECRRLDYLPFQCASCKRQFCESHHLPSAHACQSAPANTVPTCPICQSAVPVPSSMTPNDAMALHIDAGCPKRHRDNPQCSLPTCSVRDPAATNCVACHRVFCVAHCVEINHDCTSVKPKVKGVFGSGKGVVPTRTNAPAAASSSKTHAKPAKSVRNDHLPGRLDFLNTATSPIGDPKVDPEDRIALSVFFPAESQQQPRYMYFSVKNSAGKLVDVIQKFVPKLPSPPAGTRYSLYAVKSDLARVNLLPYITPLRDLGDILNSGDMIVLQVGDSGLDRKWLSALQSLSAPRFMATPLARKIPKLPSLRKSNKCLMA